MAEFSRCGIPVGDRAICSSIWLRIALNRWKHVFKWCHTTQNQPSPYKRVVFIIFLPRGLILPLIYEVVCSRYETSEKDKASHMISTARTWCQTFRNVSFVERWFATLSKVSGTISVASLCWNRDNGVKPWSLCEDVSSRSAEVSRFFYSAWNTKANSLRVSRVLSFGVKPGNLKSVHCIN